MVGYKLNTKDIKLLKKLMDKFGEIAKAAQEFCKKRSLIYTESSRKKASKILHQSGYFAHKEALRGTTKDTIDLDKIYHETKGRKLNDSKFYIVTWAQNSTPIHDEFFKNLLAYKEFLNAELSVILGRYKNPTSVFTDEGYESWDNNLRPYWDVDRHDIHKFVTILGDVKIQPTAVNPLTGLESITGGTTTIVGHPKLHLKPIPVLEGHPKKILATTGAITVPNYTDSKAGKKAEAKHKIGFTIIEIKDEEIFYIRQVSAITTDGSFTDLFFNVSNGEVREVESAEAIVWGDTHIGAMNPEILAPTEKLIDDLDIKFEVHHDLIDGASVNNHIVNNPVEQHKRWKENKEFVEVEFKSTINFLKRRPDTHKIIVQSNHNDRFDRWINSQDWKRDIPNAKAYLKYTLATLEGKANKGILAYVLEENFSEEDVTCLDYDDSYIINSHEIAHHGHIGANGSRGSVEQFRKMSTNLIVGHYHKPMRMDEVVSVGTSTKLREGYNKGASDWLNAHAIIHNDGSVQHIIFIKGHFTTLKRGMI